MSSLFFVAKHVEGSIVFSFCEACKEVHYVFFLLRNIWGSPLYICLRNMWGRGSIEPIYVMAFEGSSTFFLEMHVKESIILY